MRKPDKLTVCAYCGRPVAKWTYQLKSHPRHFCNNQCKGKWMSLNLIAEKSANWKGGRYSTIAKVLCNSRYRRIRKTLLKLDNYKCVLCSSTDNLQAHHIIEKGVNPALIWDLTNMVTLCRKCHFSIRGREKSFMGLFNDIVEKRSNSVEPKADAKAIPSQTSKEEVCRDYMDAPKGMI